MQPFLLDEFARSAEKHDLVFASPNRHSRWKVTRVRKYVALLA
jgi:hypothetical protein